MNGKDRVGDRLPLAIVEATIRQLRSCAELGFLSAESSER